MSDGRTDARLLGLTAQIVSAHVSKNPTPTDTLPALIQSVFKSLAGAGAPNETVAKLEPAVPIKKSVFPDHLICLEDGKKLTMLKRHLATAYQMTPDQYRQRWGLPSDYPMVAPEYAARRSELAKSIGLGRGGKRAQTAPAVAPAPSKRRGRPSK